MRADVDGEIARLQQLAVEPTPGPQRGRVVIDHEGPGEAEPALHCVVPPDVYPMTVSCLAALHPPGRFVQAVERHCDGTPLPCHVRTGLRTLAPCHEAVSDRDRAVRSVWRADEGDRCDRGPGGGGADSAARGAVGGGERGARDGGAAGAACVAVEVRPDQRKDVWSGRDRRTLRSRSCPVRGAVAKVGKLAGNEADRLLRKARAARLGTGRKGRRRASENGSVLRGWRLSGLSVGD
jgi:hypothetical protein